MNHERIMQKPLNEQTPLNEEVLGAKLRAALDAAGE